MALSYNSSLHTQATSVVTGRILNIAYTNGFQTIGVSYVYTDADDNVIEQSAWNIEGADNIDALFAQIEPYLPPTAGECQDTLNKFIVGMMFIAANTWATDIADWEIVDDIPVV